MLIASLLGVVGAVPFLLLGQVWAYVLVSVAGLVAALLVTDRRQGLVGLFLGIAAPFVVYGAYEVARKMAQCASDACSGMSSPNMTLVIVVAFGLIGLASGAAGYIAGRLARAVAIRLAAS